MRKLMNTHFGEGSVVRFLNFKMIANSTVKNDVVAAAIAQIQNDLSAIVFGTNASENELTFFIRPSTLRSLSVYLRNSSILQAATLADICVVDRIGSVGRFTVKYLFLSLTTSARMVATFSCNETSTIPSLAAPFVNAQRIFASAGWLEREVWDMFGLYFSEHGDLRRILTDYGFTGHPLRKDFPLTGFNELAYNDAEGRVAASAVELAQELRVFKYASA